jgi:hypothetical protein
MKTTEEDYERRERECIAEYDGKVTPERAREIAAEQVEGAQKKLWMAEK